MTNREMYYSYPRYSSMSIDKLADYINIHADLIGPCGDCPECCRSGDECLECCRKWLVDDYDLETVKDE